MRIIHLSDIHLGKQHAFSCGGKSDPRALADVLAQLKTVHSSGRSDLIVISGDIGWSGTREDYNEAFTFCHQLRSTLGTEIVIAPGNHDVDRSEGVTDDSRQDNYIEFLHRLYDRDSLSRYYPFLDSASTSLPRRERLLSIYRDEERELIVVTVNSAARIHGWTYCRECRCRLRDPCAAACVNCGEVPALDEPSILIEPAVVREIEKLLPPLDSDRSLRVFVLHHNIFPFTEPESKVEFTNPGMRSDTTMLANSARLQAWLARNGFHLVLHGHKHQPHGRHDALFRRDDDGREGQRVVVLGAGSTGVQQKERGTEPLSFFVIDVDRLSNQRFQVQTSAKKIQVSDLVPRITTDFPSFSLEVGPPSPASPVIFYAERMTDCHAAICRQAREREGLLRNFVSIVDSTNFERPATTRLEGQEVSEEDIEASFCALHPEYDAKNGGWGSLDAARGRLTDIRPRFRFQHGPRIFGPKRGSEAHKDDSGRLESPIEKALSHLKSRQDTSHGFIGLFHPPVDLVADIGQPPALTGIQFSIGEPHRLDVTFMFRKLDLSFWWVVNMLEAMRLWHWTKEYLRNSHSIERGRITFFATLAEWKKTGSSATFKIDLDEKPIEALVEVVLRADRGDGTELVRLLREKRERTNHNNIDSEGLDTLIRVTEGILNVSPRDQGRLEASTLMHLVKAREALRKANQRALKDDIHAVSGALREAKECIQRAEATIASRR